MPGSDSHQPSLPAGSGVLMWIRLYPPVFSGLAAGVALTARALEGRGISVSILTSRFPGLARRETVEGVRVARALALRSRRAGLTEGSFVLAGSWHLFRVRETFSVLHVHAPSPLTFIPIVVARALGKRVIVQMSLLGSDDPVGRPETRFRALRWLSFRLAHAVVSISPPLSEAFRDGGHDPRKLVEIPNSVDVDRYRPARPGEKRELRAELGLPLEGPLVAFVGAVNERKGVDLLVEALALLAQSGREVHGVLVGPFERDEAPMSMAQPEFLQRLRSQIEAEGLTDHVHLVGPRSDVDRFLRAADLFVFPSRREGFGTVIIEAMACGLPVVVGELDGIARSILRRPDQGQVVDEPCGRAYADAIQRILDDPELARRMGSAGRERVETRYALQVVVESHTSLYRQILDGGDPADAPILREG